MSVSGWFLLLGRWAATVLLSALLADLLTLGAEGLLLGSLAGEDRSVVFA